jgi:hypothetical protein
MTASQKGFYLLLLLPRQVWRELNDLGVGQFTAPEMHAGYAPWPANSTHSERRYEPLVGARKRAQRTNGLGSGTAHGNGTAFSAVAPSERPVLPSIDPIFGSGIPPGPNGHPTFHSLIRFRFLWA